MHKMFYLDCGGKTDFTANLIVKIMKHNYDIVILANAYDIIKVVEKKLPEYKFVNTNYKRGISVLSKTNVEVKDIDYKVDNLEINKKYTMDKYKERLVEITCADLKIIAVSAPYNKPYKQIFMVKLIDAVKNILPDFIIGNFNTGYLDDALDKKDFQFTTGFIGFTALENMGYRDPNKSMGLFSYESEIGNRERVDHVFIRNKIFESKYIDMIHFGFDHKGVQVNY